MNELINLFPAFFTCICAGARFFFRSADLRASNDPDDSQNRAGLFF